MNVRARSGESEVMRPCQGRLSSRPALPVPKSHPKGLSLGEAASQPATAIVASESELAYPAIASVRLPNMVDEITAAHHEAAHAVAVLMTVNRELDEPIAVHFQRIDGGPAGGKNLVRPSADHP